MTNPGPTPATSSHPGRGSSPSFLLVDSTPGWQRGAHALSCCGGGAGEAAGKSAATATRGSSVSTATRGSSAATAKATHGSTAAATTTTRSSSLDNGSRSVASFSPITPAPIRIGEDQPPPSWDPVPSPRVTMVGRASPRLNMVGRVSPRCILLSKGAKKKPSPKPRKPGGSPKEKVRAVWNPALEKTLVELLHEYKTPDHRGQNGWPSESWNKIVTEFHVREDYVHFTKAQIQEKEKELKRDYRLLKDAKQQSGCHFDEKTGRIKACPAVWKNILDSYPKAKKFRNKGFPLYEALGELYDGQTAEGTYNYTSNQLENPTHVENGDREENLEVLNFADLEDELMEVEDGQPQTGATVTRNTEDDERTATVTRNTEDDERAATVTGNTDEREPKRKKKISIEGLMERYIHLRAKQAEDEAVLLAKEKEESERNDFSIKKCISVVITMDITKEEKAKSFNLFKDPDNRQIFLSACDEDSEVALIWLKGELE